VLVTLLCDEGERLWCRTKDGKRYDQDRWDRDGRSCSIFYPRPDGCYRADGGDDHPECHTTALFLFERGIGFLWYGDGMCACGQGSHRSMVATCRDGGASCS